jgi:hypothetical protein
MNYFKQKMKKNTFLLLVFCSFLGFAQFPETFDNEIPSSWAVFLGDNGLGASRTWHHNTDYESALVFWDEDTNGGIAENWLVTPQFKVTSEASILTFLLTDLNEPDYDSNVSIRISTKTSQTTISDFSILKTITETESKTSTSYMDLKDYIGLDVYIAFVMTNSNGDAWILDDVNLISNQLPRAPLNPTPAVLETDVKIDISDGDDEDTDPDNIVIFSWEPATEGEAATSYNFFLAEGALENLEGLGETTSTSVAVAGLKPATTYYWVVIANNEAGSSIDTFSIWSFTTEANPSLTTKEFKRFDVSLFPNPVKDILNLKTEEKPSKVLVYNLLGKEVASFKENELKNNSINISNLSQGVYLVKVLIQDTIQSYKITKQ